MTKKSQFELQAAASPNPSMFAQLAKQLVNSRRLETQIADLMARRTLLEKGIPLYADAAGVTPKALELLRSDAGVEADLFSAVRKEAARKAVATRKANEGGAAEPAFEHIPPTPEALAILAKLPAPSAAKVLKDKRAAHAAARAAKLAEAKLAKAKEKQAKADAAAAAKLAKAEAKAAAKAAKKPQKELLHVAPTPVVTGAKTTEKAAKTLKLSGSQEEQLAQLASFVAAFKK